MTFFSPCCAPLLSAALGFGGDKDAPAATFAAPVPLEAPAAAEVAKMLYPSPVLHDVDGDGRQEMILGDLPGNLWVCEKEDGGPMAWSKPEKLQSDGAPIKFDNW